MYILKVDEFLRKENNNLDLIRLILASMVIYGHAPVFVNATGQTDFIAKYLHFTYSGNLAVLTFFLISGLLVSNSLFTKANWKVYIISRIFRLLPGLMFVSLCTIIICSYFSNENFLTYISHSLDYVYKNAILEIQYEINNVSFMRDNYPMPQYANTINGSLWTIPLEFKMYLMMLGIWFVSRCFAQTKIVLYGLLIGMVYPLFIPESVLGGAETLYMIPAFFMGSILAIEKKNINLNMYLPISLIILGKCIDHNAIVGNLLVMFGATLIFVWLASCRFLQKFRFSHDISYGVYLWGWPIEQLIGYFFPYLGYYKFLLLSLPVTFLLAYITCVLVEEPSQKLGRKVCRLFM